MGKWMTAAVLTSLPTAGLAGVLQMDFNVDGQLPHQENTNLTRISESSFTTINANNDSVSGGVWSGNFLQGHQTRPGTSPSYRYYYGENPSIAAGAGVPLSINVRMRFLSSVAVQGASANADRDFFIQARNGSGLLLMLFNYSADGLTNQIIGQSTSGATAVNTGVSFADFHTYSFVWDSLFDGTGTNGQNDVTDVYVDGVFKGTTRAFNGDANSNGSVEFGDGGTQDGTRWEVDWIRCGTGADAIAVPEPVSGLVCLTAIGLMSLRRRPI
jgi:hypothetical protein